MPAILSVSTHKPEHTVTQEEAIELARETFREEFVDIERLLRVFNNGQIKQRHFAMPLHWYDKEHSFKERNDLYVECAVNYGVSAVKKCLENQLFLKHRIDCREIDAIYFISSTGLSTPSIEARIANRLPFKSDVKRIPIWGLGCAGGAAGISRAYEHCLAYPTSKVLVVCIELCSLTFQRDDQTKSNLIGTSLFADGAACVLLVGDEVRDRLSKHQSLPHIVATNSQLLPDSEDVMGWDVEDDGLYVVFARSIPILVEQWFSTIVEQFLQSHQLTVDHVDYFIAHPGGKKVLDAYDQMFDSKRDMTSISREVLKHNGNMSSPTVLYVLLEFMKQLPQAGKTGLIGALGPGFSSELLLVEWR
ncbi:type III polyketide synthase [Desertibacillus haloalkaliphilus]|uniref:type III polyketide synthase n=1 Tax=Desertibacillus haloalkaliphilus TaxID=1328930 RepID=UPI001C253BB5|nr:type III polyketide synthase [Desertibacillus haloalkaliphilus]MBU8906378.1 type III polyketide synthase [Desertibacillus haloalkaliphilus]